MYLIDTNIWLELLLQQDKAGEVSSFFQAVDASSLAITDFTLYSFDKPLQAWRQSLFWF